MTEYETRTLSILVVPKDASIFDQNATKISIDDEAAGEFVVVSQDENIIKIDPEEWPIVRTAINDMVKECRKDLDA